MQGGVRRGRSGEGGGRPAGPAGPSSTASWQGRWWGRRACRLPAHCALRSGTSRPCSPALAWRRAQRPRPRAAPGWPGWVGVVSSCTVGDRRPDRHRTPLRLPLLLVPPLLQAQPSGRHQQRARRRAPAAAARHHWQTHARRGHRVQPPQAAQHGVLTCTVPALGPAPPLATRRRQPRHVQAHASPPPAALARGGWATEPRSTPWGRARTLAGSGPS